MLVSEGEGPNNQHDVEGGRGEGGGESMTKERGEVMQQVYVVKTIKNNTYYY